MKWPASLECLQRQGAPLFPGEFRKHSEFYISTVVTLFKGSRMQDEVSSGHVMTTNLSIRAMRSLSWFWVPSSPALGCWPGPVDGSHPAPPPTFSFCCSGCVAFTVAPSSRGDVKHPYALSVHGACFPHAVCLFLDSLTLCHHGLWPRSPPGTPLRCFRGTTESGPLGCFSDKTGLALSTRSSATDRHLLTHTWWPQKPGGSLV